jgi:hypothetical protein
MTSIYLALSVAVNIVLMAYFFIKAKQKIADGKSQVAVSAKKSLPNERIIFCPACSQQIRFTLPIKGNRAKCRKCEVKFKLEADARGNVYITEIKIPEDDAGIKSLDECYAILDIKMDAIPMDIRAAYKKKISEYHPDKVESLGSKIKQVSEDETRRINLAYSMLQEHERA